MKEVDKKIENGTIRIENGLLTGLGCGKESISIEAFDRLLDMAGRSDLVEVISDVISSIAEMQSILIEHEDMADPMTLTEFINNQLKPSLPSRRSIFYLNEILKTFNA